MTRTEGRNQGRDEDQNNAKHGRRRLLGTDRKVNDHHKDGVVATDRLNWLSTYRLKLRPLRTLQRRLQKLVHDGLLVKHGGRKDAFYRVAERM
jgi:phage repressor protein C with HTH and peptisase S24 domain